MNDRLWTFWGCKCSLGYLKDARALRRSGSGAPVLAQAGRKNSHNADLLTRAVWVVSPWKMEIFWESAEETGWWGTRPPGMNGRTLAVLSTLSR